MIRYFPLAFVLVAVSAMGAEQQRAIPDRFQGEWNAKLEHCGTSLNDSRLRISADHLQFHESGGPVRAVVTQGESDVALIAEVSGEGETWLLYRHFRLSADRACMTDITDKDAAFVRYRCPKGSK